MMVKNPPQQHTSKNFTKEKWKSKPWKILVSGFAEYKLLATKDEQINIWKWAFEIKKINWIQGSVVQIINVTPLHKTKENNNIKNRCLSFK